MTRPSMAAQTLALTAIAFAGFSVQAEAPAAVAGMTAWDRVIMESAFARADINDDGFLSRAELSRLAAMTQRFDELDADRDGTLNLEEFAAGFATQL